MSWSCTDEEYSGSWSSGAFKDDYYCLTYERLGELWYLGDRGFECVDSAVNASWGISLAIEPAGGRFAHISYHDHVPDDLKCAIENFPSPDRTWWIGTVDATGNVGAYNSLAMDASNTTHISYYDGTNGNLKYAEWGVH